MTYLLDVNVLIALLDREHLHCRLVRDWFGALADVKWATCPLTENGVLRIMGSLSYPGSPGSPAAMAPLLARLRARPDHEFWPDEISLLDGDHIDASRLLSSSSITDSYLLALARHRGGMLATLNRRLVPDAVHDGRAHLLVLS